MDVLHVTSAHVVKDTRIFVKEARALAKAGFNVGVVGPGPTHLETRSEGVALITLPPYRWTESCATCAPRSFTSMTQTF